MFMYAFKNNLGLKDKLTFNKDIELKKIKMVYVYNIYAWINQTVVVDLVFDGFVIRHDC